jgi:Protein of unknown function, DUF547
MLAQIASTPLHISAIISAISTATHDVCFVHALQTQVAALSEQDRKAFFINIYNSLVIHALIAIGEPQWLGGRLQRYATASYTIGGQTYSLNDIENGILRGNRLGAAPFSSLPFTPDDPRTKLMLPVDPRIHFALNCGAASCPPIRFYAGAKLDQQLDLAARAFLNRTTLNDRGVLEFSQIFKWYSSDFGSDDKAVLTWSLQYLTSPEKQAAAAKQLATEPVVLEYAEYDWAINEKK